MENYGLDTPIMGQSFMSYIASLIEQNEKQEIEIERAKQSVSMLKQFNNHARLRLDASKHSLKLKEFELEQREKSLAKGE